jgi:hypothetical protein
MTVSLSELHQLHYQKIPLKIIDDRIPIEFQNKPINQFNTISPHMVGGYLLKVEGHDNVIRLGGNGNTEYPHNELYNLEVELCL